MPLAGEARRAGPSQEPAFLALRVREDGACATNRRLAEGGKPGCRTLRREVTLREGEALPEHRPDTLVGRTDS